MALAFPLAQASLGDLLPIQSVVWELGRQQEMAGYGSGEFIVADLAPPLWEGEVSLRPLLHTDARAMAAKINALDGGVQSFYLANPLAWWPKADPRGVVLGAATPSILAINANRKELSFTGLPGGYALNAGDMFAVDYGSPSRRGLHQLVADVTAAGGGSTAQVEIRPHLRPGIATTLAVDFSRPAAKVKMVPGSVRQSFHSSNRTRISFRVRQTLAAG
jgi:hypothetical protein